MIDRLKQARANIEPGSHGVLEYNARMGGNLDAAIMLISAVESDATENLDRNPEDEATKGALVLLAQTRVRLEALVVHLCPLTATARVQEVTDG